MLDNKLPEATRGAGTRKSVPKAPKPEKKTQAPKASGGGFRV